MEKDITPSTIETVAKIKENIELKHAQIEEKTVAVTHEMLDTISKSLTTMEAAEGLHGALIESILTDLQNPELIMPTEVKIMALKYLGANQNAKLTAIISAFKNESQMGSGKGNPKEPEQKTLPSVDPLRRSNGEQVTKEDILKAKGKKKHIDKVQRILNSVDEINKQENPEDDEEE